jgi:hypothetical protein
MRKLITVVHLKAAVLVINPGGGERRGEPAIFSLPPRRGVDNSTEKSSKE